MTSCINLEIDYTRESELVKLKHINDDCNCVIQYEFKDKVYLLCSDKDHNIIELEVRKSLIEKCR